jgi:hypothetical protein
VSKNNKMMMETEMKMEKHFFVAEDRLLRREGRTF